MLVSIKEQTYCEEANSQSGEGETGLQPLMMMEYNLLHKAYNEGVTQQSIGNAFAMKALPYLGMNNSSFD